MSVEIKDESCESGKRRCTVTSVNPETGEFRVGFWDNGSHHSRLLTLDDLVVEGPNPQLEDGKGKPLSKSDGWPRPVSEVLAKVLSGEENPETK